MVTIGRSNLQSKMMPTDKLIIKYKDRKGESYVAREIKLENGYTCAAVFNVKKSQSSNFDESRCFKKHCWNHYLKFKHKDMLGILFKNKIHKDKIKSFLFI